MSYPNGGNASMPTRSRAQDKYLHAKVEATGADIEIYGARFKRLIKQAIRESKHPSPPLTFYSGLKDCGLIYSVPQFQVLSGGRLEHNLQRKNP